MNKSNYKWNFSDNDELRKKIRLRRASFGQSYTRMGEQVLVILNLLKLLYTSKIDLKIKDEIRKSIEKYFWSKPYVDFFDIRKDIDPESLISSKYAIENFIKASPSTDKPQPATLDFYALYIGYAGIIGYEENNKVSLASCFRLETLGLDVIKKIVKENKEFKDLGEKSESEILRFFYPDETEENKTTTIPQYLTTKVPLLREDQIVGRSEDLKDLHSRLFEKKQVVLVNGMGGIGKTTVGAVYTTEYSSEYKHVAWISQLSDNDFLNSFINATGLLDRLNIAKKDKTIDELFSEILTVFSRVKDTPCLMVIDNADAGLSKFYNDLPKQPDWHILVTSREEIPYFDVKELGFLNEEDAIKLFKKNYKRTGITDEDIKSIVQEIDYHTLTIEILAKTANHHRTPLKYILKAIENDIEADITIRHSTQKIERITSYLCSIFKLSNLSKNEVWLLANLACLPPVFHTYKAFKELVCPENTKRIDFAKHLSNLTSKGWLLFNETNDSYKLHRILTDVICKSLTIEIETIQPLLSTVTSLLSTDYVKDNPIDKFKWIPYAKAILKQFKTDTSSSLAIFQNNMALVLQDFGGKENLEEARELLEKAIKSNEGNFGESHPTTAITYSNLALLFLDFGTKENLEEAKGLLEKAIKSDEGNFGKSHPATVGHCSNMAIILRKLGGKENLEEARELLEKVIKSNEGNLGESHPTTAGRYGNMALVLQDLGEKENLEKAKILLEKAIKSDKSNFGESHPNTAISYSNLALVLRDLGEKENLKEAKELLEKAIKSDEGNFGESHPTTRGRYCNMALVLQDLGGKENLEKAKMLLKKVIKSTEGNFGKSHTNMASCYSNLALVLQDLGGKEDLEEAKELLEKAKKIIVKNLGANHPSSRIIIKNFESHRKSKEKDSL